MIPPQNVPYQSLIEDSKQGSQPKTFPDAEAGLPPAAAPIRLAYWTDLMRNKPQRNSMNAAYFLFKSAGMSIAYSIGFSLIQHSSTHIRMCWFIGAIIGSLIGLALVERFTKRLIYFLAIGLVSVNGMCFTCAPGDSSLLTLGRYCDGLAFGIILPAFIMAASEQSDKRFRAMTLGIEHVCITVGMFVQVIFTLNMSTAINANIAHGVFVLIYVVASLLSNLICTMESPVYHLRNDNEAEAINVLHSLRRRLVDSNEVPELLTDHKQLLKDDAARGMKANLMLGLGIYPKILVLFILTTISFSVPILDGLMGASLFDVRHLMMSRLAGVIIGCYVLDTVGRRAVTSFSLLAGGILLIIFGILFVESPNKSQQAEMAIMLFQLFAGIVATSSTSYLGEAFSVSVKPYFIVISLCLGCLVQIFLFLTFGIAHVDVFAYIVGAIQVLFAGYFFVTTHETKETSLRAALVQLGKPGMLKLF